MKLDIPIKEGQTIYYWDNNIEEANSGEIASIQLTSYAIDEYDVDVVYWYYDTYYSQNRHGYGRVGTNVWLSKDEVVVTK